MTETIGVLAERVAGQVAGWGPARWRATTPASGSRTRREVLYELVQHLADLCADVEGRQLRRVPHLENDYALPDQLRVVAADLDAAGPDELTGDKALVSLRETHRVIFA
ncbi:hypothetical protein [Phytomonospora endophytica]|uniref:Uncharacterized protein n=1 Tax=Phytomonospora endophytica TaxID=714109 RepID=A0A841FKX4_9ACTN|nr:hypothetical protein [Phytomonospora endophytica]MBB6036504.1 hypothetical protein [Phytomonospora endophytica]GIG65826.1 hypothetical protein Pen01_21210 [Phytomonospora endophytica]